MSTLAVSVSEDYSSQILSNIDTISFVDNWYPWPSVATFDAGQFNNAQIFDDVAISGAIGVQGIVVNGGSIDARNWSFSNWAPFSDTVTFNGTSVHDLISGTSQNDTINGEGGGDTLYGDAGIDTLNGGGGADILVGEAGNDSLSGGTGNDEFHYNDVSELSNQETIEGGAGRDTVVLDAPSGGTFIFGTNFKSVEVLEFGHGAQAVLYDDNIQSSGLHRIIGSGDLDTLFISGRTIDLSGWSFAGWGLNTASKTLDVISINGDLAMNSLTGSSQNDVISGGGNSDTLSGGRGDDVLIGGDGPDSMDGGLGRDTFLYTSGAEAEAGETLSGGGGDDTISVTNLAAAETYDFRGATIQGVETLYFGSGADPDSTASVLLTDQQIGAGSITSVDASAPGSILVVEGGQIDLSGVEMFVNGFYSATLDVKLNGTAGGDTIIGSTLGDQITGGAGADTLAGGDGADIFVLKAMSDVVAGESIDGGSGVDAIRLAAGFSGTADFRSETITAVERLVMSGNGQAVIFDDDQIAGFARISGTGTTQILEVDGASIDMSGVTFANWNASSLILLIGTGSKDTITGSSQDDIIGGDSGFDVLDGGDGDDILAGGLNHDELTGGGGADIFTYTDLADTQSGTGFGADEIEDFTQGADLIDLSAAADLIFIGTAAFSGTGAAELRYHSNGSTTYLQFDSNGDGTVDGQINVIGDIAFQASDLVL